MPFVRSYVLLKRSVSWIDLLVLAAVAALLFGLIGFGREWSGQLRPTVEIDLSPWSLPEYTFYSLVRGFAAYFLSLLFTLVYGYAAAYVPRAEKVLVPVLDILQSIPVLGFLPGLVLALVALFPHSNVGLELAAVLMIFTGQVWNMTFSFYNSLRSIPMELREAGRVYKLGWWRRFTQLELPFAAIGLIWNSMMSMAGGWFFLTISEAFVLGNKDFRLPGIGSYMSVAIATGDIPAMFYAIAAMVLMIILVDQIFWRPIVVWAEKYKVEDTQSVEAPSSWVFTLLRRSRLLHFTRTLRKPARVITSHPGQVAPKHVPAVNRVTTTSIFIVRSLEWMVAAGVLTLVAWGSWQLLALLSDLSMAHWLQILWHLFLTLLRVGVAVAVGTLLMLPVGVAIGMNPKLSKVLQPVVQVAASFPAPMLFPLVIMLLSGAGIGIEIGAVVLMMLGTQWYLLFNIVAGAMAIPQELREVALVSRLPRRKTWKRLILPGVFPSLVTGWVTATGGAWNASIVSEYVHFGNETLVATGLGSTITMATDKGDFGVLAASVLLMAGSVVLINKLFWKKMYRKAETLYSLNT